MVSDGVSKLWKTSIVFADKGVKVDAKYYQDHLLAVLILKMSDLADDDHYVFMQDGARAHTAKTTLEYLNKNVAEYIEPSSWPPNSPDLNPVDYFIWSRLESNVFSKKIVDLEQLKERIVECWEEFPQGETRQSIHLEFALKDALRVRVDILKNRDIL